MRILMKNFTLILLFLLTFSFAAFGQKTKPATTANAKTNTTASDEKAVRSAFDDLMRSIENSNVEGTVAAYWNSPDLLIFNNNGTVTRGWEQNRKNRESSYPKIKNVKLETSNVRVSMLGRDAALVTFQWKQSQEYDNKPETASGRTTLVYQKVGKDWKVIHVHTSPDNAPASRPIFPSERQPIVDN